MKKSELKQLIKPLIKECIHEALIEEGLLSNVVSEVVKGMGTSPLVEHAQPQLQEQEDNFAAEVRAKNAADRSKMQQHRKKLMDAIGSDAYNGVNLFEGTQPLTQHQATDNTQSKGSVDLGDPSDAGVDISSIMGGASRMWDAMKQRKCIKRRNQT